jgi:hypothetical protein
MLTWSGRALTQPWAALGILLLLTLGQMRLFDRLLYSDASQYGFVLQNVDGVLKGRPVSKSWQQRFLAPGLVVALDRVTHDRLQSLRWFMGLCCGAANRGFFALCRARGWLPGHALLAVLCFALVRLLYTFRLEYPWDGVDILLMLGFGFGFGRGYTLAQLWPLLLPGVLNHETILYAPLYELFAAAMAPRSWRRALRAGLWLIACSACIYGLRERFYLGQPNWPGQEFEHATPLLQNHLHVWHNLRQWFWLDLWEGRIFISLSLSCAVLWLCRALIRPTLRVAALWCLCVLASVVCFGYVNETRHYLLLIAFWFAYAAACFDPQGAQEQQYRVLKDTPSSP